MLEDVLLAVGLELPDFAAPDLIDCLAELPRDVEAIKNIQRLRGLLGDDVQVRRPHVAADEPELGAALRTELFEKQALVLDAHPRGDRKRGCFDDGQHGSGVAAKVESITMTLDSQETQLFAPGQNYPYLEDLLEI